MGCVRIKDPGQMVQQDAGVISRHGGMGVVCQRYSGVLTFVGVKGRIRLDGYQENIPLFHSREQCSWNRLPRAAGTACTARAQIWDTAVRHWVMVML